jgi:hypothetical protein
MKTKIILTALFLSIFVFNLSYAQISLYYENARFNLFYNFSKLIANPISKISYLNSLLDYSLKTSLKFNGQSRNKYLANYRKVLNDLEKEWSNFSFKYSQYKDLYERSLDLYIEHYLTAKNQLKNQDLQMRIVKVLNKTVYGIDSEEGIKYLLSKLKDLSEKEKEEILAAQGQSELLEKIDFKTLTNLVNKLKKITKEFEEGKRILTIDYKIAEDKLKEIQQNVDLARKNILEGNYEEFNKNIQKINENITFIEKNSKLVK